MMFNEKVKCRNTYFERVFSITIYFLVYSFNITPKRINLFFFGGGEGAYGVGMGRGGGGKAKYWYISHES